MEAYFQKPEGAKRGGSQRGVEDHTLPPQVPLIFCARNFTGVIQPGKYLRKLEPVLDAKEQSWCRQQRACWTSRRGTSHVCMRSKSRNDEDDDELKSTGASKINYFHL